MGFFDDVGVTTDYKEIDLSENPEGLTPEQAKTSYAVAKTTGTPLDEVSQQMRDDYAKRKLFEGSGDAFKRAMANPTFREAVKGDEAAFFSVENAVNAIRPDDPQNATGWFGTLRNAASRGIISLDQADNASDAVDYRKELDRLREPGNEKELALRGKDLEDRIRAVSQVIARNETARELLTPKDSPMQRAAKAFESDGVLAAVGELLGSPIDSVTDLFAEASVPMAAVIGAGAAAGGVATSVASLPAATVLALSALAAGAASYWQNSNTSVIERMQRLGVDTKNADAVADFLTYDSRFNEVQNEAMSYAAPVAATDALSFGLSKIVFTTPIKLGERVYHSAPAAARVYEQFNANAYRHAFQNVATEATVQGTLGAGGEALGQINADGGITDPLSIFINGVADIITSPMEIAGASIATRGALRSEAARVAYNAEQLKKAVEVAQNSAAMKETPELLDSFAQSVAEANPQVERIGLDVASISQAEGGAELLGQVKAVLPGLASDIDHAVTTGGTVEVPLADYFRLTQNEALAQTVIDNSVIDSSMTLAQAQGGVKIDDGDLSIQKLISGESVDFKASLVEVAHEYKTILSQSKTLTTANGKLTTEAKAALALTMNHIAVMAKDAGMTPRGVWDAYGIKSIEEKLDADMPQPLGGRTGAVVGYYTPTTQTITRAVSADRSTLLHETGHWFWINRMKLAQSLKSSGAQLTEAQKRFVDLSEQTAKWLGAKDLDDFLSKSVDDSRNWHEKFARTYEAYLMTGQAPTPALVSVFRKFSSWLRQIYGVLAGIPEAAEMKPEVKELFDSLFVSYEQAHEAQLRRHLFLTLRDLVEGNSSDTDVRDAINALFADADAAAVEKMMAQGKYMVRNLRAMRDNVSNDLLKQAADLRKKYTAEAIEAAMPPDRVKADTFFNKTITHYTKGGTKGHFRPKLLESDLIKMGLTGDEIKALIDRGFVTQKRGAAVTHGDLAPLLLGFPNKEAMVRAMLKDPFNGVDPEDAVRPQVEARMQADHPEIADQTAIRDNADAAVFNPTAEQIISLEIRFLSGAKGKPVDMELYNAVARASLMGIKLGDLNPKKYRDNATRLAEQAQRAISKDPLLAASLKRQQLVQMRMAVYAQDALSRATEFAKTLRKKYPAKLRDGKSMPIEYLEQLQELLVEVGINTEHPENRANIPAWDDFYANESQFGVPEKPDNFGATPYYEMTLAEYADAEEFLNGFINAARMRQRLIINGKAADAKAFDAAQAQAILDNAARRGLKPARRNASEHAGTVTRLKEFWNSFYYGHMRGQTMWQIFEGKQGGHFVETLGRMLDSARDTENEMQFTKGAEFAKALEAFVGELSDKQAVRYDSLGGYFDKLQMLAIALNCGNEENFNRLIEGSDKYFDFRDADQLSKKWTKDDVLQAVGEAFTKEQLEKIQGVWDVCGSLGDQLEEIEARTNNRRMKRVKAQKIFIPLPNGTVVELKGGYYPIKYDKRAAIFDSKRDPSDMGGRSPVMRKVDTANAKDRVGGGGRPVELTLAAGMDALNDTIHVIAWRDVVMNLRKLLGSGTETTKAITTYFGREAYSTVTEWVNDIATNGSELKTDSWLNTIRKNASVAGLGLNFVTAMLQPIGNVQSVAVVGGKYCAGAMARYVAKPRESREFVMANSRLMASRMRTRFKEIREVQKYYTNGKASKVDRVRSWVYTPIAFSQVYTVDIPTWMAGFERGLVEGQGKGLSGDELHDFAVSRADRLLVESQGGGDLSDLAHFERTRNIFNVFYGFFGTVLNATSIIGKSDARLVDKLARLGLILLVQPIAEAFLRAGLEQASDDSSDDYRGALGKRVPKDLGSFWLGQMMGFRELSEVISVIAGENARYAGPSGLRGISDAYNFAQQIGQGEFDRALRKASVNFLLGDLCGMPAVAINRFLDAAEAMGEGEYEQALINAIVGDKRKNL